MYCISCGEKITSSDAGFCVKCGSRLDEGVLRDQENTEVLVLRMKSGDRDAFAQLYSENYSSVLLTVRSVVRDEDAALDILQDVFIKAYQNIDLLKEGDHFLPWVRQIANHMARKWLLKKKPDLFSRVENDGEEFGDSFEDRLEDESVYDTPEETIDRSETTRLLSEILKDLPDDQRDVIKLFYWDEMSITDIAKHLGITESAVRSRLKYGKAKIVRATKHLY